MTLPGFFAVKLLLTIDALVAPLVSRLVLPPLSHADQPRSTVPALAAVDRIVLAGSVRHLAIVEVESLWTRATSQPADMRPVVVHVTALERRVYPATAHTFIAAFNFLPSPFSTPHWLNSLLLFLGMHSGAFSDIAQFSKSAFPLADVFVHSVLVQSGTGRELCVTEVTVASRVKLSVLLLRVPVACFDVVKRFVAIDTPILAIVVLMCVMIFQASLRQKKSLTQLTADDAQDVTAPSIVRRQLSAV